MTYNVNLQNQEIGSFAIIISTFMVADITFISKDKNEFKSAKRIFIFFLSTYIKRELCSFFFSFPSQIDATFEYLNHPWDLFHDFYLKKL